MVLRRAQPWRPVLALVAMAGLRCSAFHIPSPLVSGRLRQSPAQSCGLARPFEPSRAAFPCVQPSVGLARRHAALSAVASPSLEPTGRSPKKAGPQRSALLKRILAGMVGFAALALVASQMPMSVSLAPGGRGPVLAAALSPFTSTQSRLMELSQGPAGPVFGLLSWAVDALEVGYDAARWVLCLLASPLLALYHAVSPQLSLLLRDPVLFAQSAGQGAANLVMAVVTYPFLVAGLAVDATVNGLQGLWSWLVRTLRLPGFFAIDYMDPRLHIPYNPTRFVVARDIKIKSGFGLKEMYGRRWPVHAGKWTWALNYWDRLVMESQLVRYLSTYAASAEKTEGLRFLVKGPAPQLGGTILIFALIYYTYYTSQKAAMWYKSLEANTYGKLKWNPVSRISSDHLEEKEEGEDKKGDDEDEDEE